MNFDRAQQWTGWGGLLVVFLGIAALGFFSTGARESTGYGEQISILRGQLNRVLAGDLRGTTDFARLNQIADAAIADAQVLKAAL